MLIHVAFVDGLLMLQDTICLAVLKDSLHKEESACSDALLFVCLSTKFPGIDAVDPGTKVYQGAMILSATSPASVVFFCINSPNLGDSKHP